MGLHLLQLQLLLHQGRGLVLQGLTGVVVLMLHLRELLKQQDHQQLLLLGGLLVVVVVVVSILLVMVVAGLAAVAVGSCWVGGMRRIYLQP
jgi:hypothetical protein